MPTIELYGGPLKRTIVQQAYGMCGQSPAEFELTNEEYDLALGFLNGIMSELLTQWGVDLGFNFPDYGNGAPQDESGIANDAMRSVSRMLAEDIAPTIGKAITSRISLSQARGALVSVYQPRVARQMTSQTPRGAGNMGPGYLGPFFDDVQGSA